MVYSTSLSRAMPVASPRNCIVYYTFRALGGNEDGHMEMLNSLLAGRNKYSREGIFRNEESSKEACEIVELVEGKKSLQRCLDSFRAIIIGRLGWRWNELVRRRGL